MTSTRNVIWIASYPKSGNTWLRFLVSNLVFGPQESAAALNRLAPDVHELAEVPQLPDAPVLMKTHFPYSPSMPLADRTGAALYIVRHPADVMLSNFHYARRRGGLRSDDATVLADYLAQYVTARGDPRWIAAGMGPWDEHVRSWLAVRHPFPVLPLRYEDLLGSAGNAARAICTFLGLPRSGEEIDRAVAGASFERMSEIERSDIAARRVGIFYKPYLEPSIEAGLRFMRSGKAGESVRALTAEQRDRVREAFGAVMRELGYEAAGSSGA